MSDASTSAAESQLRLVDRDLLIALRRSGAVGIGELTDVLDVTATAVRQRVDRLLQMGLIEREKIVAGRGRPTYRYRLTVAGHRRAGANATQLAEAMWREILSIGDIQVRQQVITAIATRLGQEFAAQMDLQSGADSFEQRMQKLSQMMSSRQIDSAINQTGELPVLDIDSCPYPSLTDASDDRAMCKLEEQMISEALGQPVHLSSCRLDGDACCQFSAGPAVNQNQ